MGPQRYGDSKDVICVVNSTEMAASIAVGNDIVESL